MSVSMDLQAVKLLLDQGALKDQQNSLGWTPLHEASFFNQVSRSMSGNQLGSLSSSYAGIGTQVE